MADGLGERGVLGRGSKTEPEDTGWGGGGSTRPVPDARPNAGIASVVPAEVRRQDTRASRTCLPSTGRLSGDPGAAPVCSGGPPGVLGTHENICSS